MITGGVAQLGERLPCTQEVIGSNPFTSTRKKSFWRLLNLSKRLFFLGKRVYAIVHTFFDNLDMGYKHLLTSRFMSVVLWPSY